MTDTRPNLLLITTDQHRYDWLGCHGTEGVDTPHLDRLAAGGMRFTHHVTNAAVCAPARIAMATGLRPTRLGALSNAAVLDPSVPTYYQRLRDQGYRVGCVGKLDLNKPDQFNGRRGDRPDLYRWGFTHPVEVEGKMHAGGLFGKKPFGPYGFWLRDQGLWESFADDYDTRMEEIVNAKYGHDAEPGDAWYRDSVLPTEAFADSYIGRRAVEWLGAVPDEHPWHLFVSFVGPHDPFDPPTEWAQRFRAAPVPVAFGDDMAGKPARVAAEQYPHSPAQMLEARRQYTAALALIDHQVGEILGALDAAAGERDTYVVFTSDHGEMLGDHGLFQKGVAYEPAMRIPLIVRGPAVAAGVSPAATELVDVTATMLELAGIPVDGLDGRSLAPVLADPDQPFREAVVCAEWSYRAIRTDRWKYIHNAPPAAGAPAVHELYDLASDPTELHNLVETGSAEVRRLRSMLAAEIGEDALEIPPLGRRQD